MFSDPEKNIEQLGLEPGMSVADLGAGSGFYAIAAARAVLGAGRVYAIDVQKDLLQKIKTNAHREHLANVEVLWGDLEKLGGTRLRDLSVDVAIVANTLFQIKDKNTLLLEAKRILKPKGRLLIIDWSDSFGGIGPHKDEVLTLASAKTLCEKAGFAFEHELSAGSHHYGLVFRKS